MSIGWEGRTWESAVGRTLAGRSQGGSWVGRLAGWIWFVDRFGWAGQGPTAKGGVDFDPCSTVGCPNHQVMCRLWQRGSSILIAIRLHRGSSISSADRLCKLLQRRSSISITTPLNELLHRRSFASIAAIPHLGSSISVTSSSGILLRRSLLQRAKTRVTRSAGRGLPHVAHFIPCGRLSFRPVFLFPHPRTVGGCTV